jgi:hypothetical protein
MRLLRMLVVAGLGLAGCGNTTGVFQEVVKHQEEVVDLTKASLLGHERLEFRKSVPSDVASPTFEGRWNPIDQEHPVDVYLVKASDYHANVRPDSLEHVYWSSLLGALEGIGTLRTKEIHIHPKAGDWVLVFYNSADVGPQSKSEFSAQIALSYFK